jgi:hypothetical protein
LVREGFRGVGIVYFFSAKTMPSVRRPPLGLGASLRRPSPVISFWFNFYCLLFAKTLQHDAVTGLPQPVGRLAHAGYWPAATCRQACRHRLLACRRSSAGLHTHLEACGAVLLGAITNRAGKFGLGEY